MGTYALTGGASGIGAALAASLKEAGHEVITVDIKDADIVADLSKPEGRQAAVAGVRERAPQGLDGLVPLAGVAGGGPPGTLITSVNYFGTIEFVNGLRDLVGQKQGTIVLLCSNSATMQAPNDKLLNALLSGDEAESLRISEAEDNGMHYMVGKRAINYWMRRNCMEFAKAGVRMNAVAPGPIDTAMTAPLFEDPEMAPVMQGLLDATPMARMGQPEEIVNCINFLLSPESSYVCGSVLFIDGGYDAHTRQDHI
ncbi:MAG: SDR family oxidoreductase [Gammaproteobacteria bacterium]|nr:SDR family oxidoreductase [Gammaproteobacteria bacterium]